MSEAVQNLNASAERTYELVMKSSDYKAAHRFLHDQEARADHLSFPTMLAMENGDIVGLLSTFPRKDMIMAGPMVIKKDKPRNYTVLRLLEAYEALLQSLGIVTYTIFCDYASNKLMKTLLKLPMTDVIAENSEGVLFARRLKNAQPEN